MRREIKNKNKVYLIYTALFGIIFFLIYYIFLKTGKSFIWHEDGAKQHFAILYNFNYIIRNIFTNGIETFSWNLGLGLDLISQYSYYILGDPFAYLSLLFPMEKLELAYNILIVVRMYFIGIAFLVYCRYNKKDEFNSLLGCVIYTFCGFVLYAGLRHPYFLNAVILLPLVFMGIDKLLKEDKILHFTLVIAIATISNYYFLYMITILSLLYAIIKFISEYRETGIKTFFNKFLKAFLGYVIGLLIGGILLLPNIYGYLNSNRLTDNDNVIYNLKYYSNLFTGFTSNNSLYWSRICTTSFTLLMLPVSLLNIKKDKENRTIIINIILTTIMLLIPFCGSIMNGFSFSTNRWTFGYVFLLTYMVVLNFRKDLNYNKKELISMFITIVIYGLGLFVIKGRAEIRISLLSLLFAIIIFIAIIITNIYRQKFRKVKYVDYLIFAIVILNIIFYGNNLCSKKGKNYVSEFVKSGSIINKYNNYDNKIKGFEKAIKTINNNDNGFYRISTNKNSYPNASLLYNYKSTNAYLSIGNRYIGILSKELANRLYVTDTNPLKGFDNRTKILTLLGNKYFVVSKKEKDTVPYGYSLYKEIKSKKEKTQIYKNDNKLEMGIFYDNYILKDDYDKLDSLQKEQILLDTAVLEDIPQYDIYNNVKLLNDVKEKTYTEVNYSIEKNKNLKNNKIKTNKKNQKIVLDIDSAENAELYLCINGFNYKGKESNIIKIKYNNIEKKQSFRNKEQDPYYFYNPNILINLGYKEKHGGKIQIILENEEEYSFDNIKVIAVSMKKYDESIKKLKQNKFELKQYNGNVINADIENNTSGVLQMSIPYTKGWTAYVDGNKTETIVVNTAFIGIPLEKGKHQIKLEYETPYLKIGLICSSIGVMAFIILSISQKIINNKNGDKRGNK